MNKNLANIVKFFCFSHTLPNYLNNLSDLLVIISKFLNNNKQKNVNTTKFLPFSHYFKRI